MKKRYRLYLETSFWGRLVERVHLDRRRITYRFLNGVWPRHRILISPLVIGEVENTSDATARSTMERQIRRVRPELVGVRGRAVRLGRELLKGGGFTDGMLADMAHLAYAVLGEADAVVTWNMRTMARGDVRLAIHAYCRKEGINAPLIGSPVEVKQWLGL